MTALYMPWHQKQGYLLHVEGRDNQPVLFQRGGGHSVSFLEKYFSIGAKHVLLYGNKITSFVPFSEFCPLAVFLCHGCGENAIGLALIVQLRMWKAKCRMVWLKL